MRPDRIRKRGPAIAPEGLRLFPSLAAEGDLQTGAQGGRKDPRPPAKIRALLTDLVAKR